MKKAQQYKSEINSCMSLEIFFFLVTENRFIDGVCILVLERGTFVQLYSVADVHIYIYVYKDNICVHRNMHYVVRE